MEEKKSAYNILWVSGPNSKFKLEGAKPAGFWVGLWHGIISPIVFIIGVFTLKVKIYETNNNGRWYDFGFLLGVGAFSGSAKKATS